MSKKLLLADDSITIQKVIGITFANEDYSLSVVDNGDAALEKARAQQPDLVLADVFMPGKNGYELCAAIKADPALQQIPVLLLAGTFEPFDEAKARKAGADGWIAKPFESQALIDRVEELLARPRPAAAAPAPAAVASPAAAAPLAPAAPPVMEVQVAAEEDTEPDLWAELGPVEAPSLEPVEPAAQALTEPLAPEGGEREDTGDIDDLWGEVSLGEEDLLQLTPAAAGKDIWEDLEAPAAAEVKQAAEPAPLAADDLWAELEPSTAHEPVAAAGQPAALEEGDEVFLTLDEEEEVVDLIEPSALDGEEEEAFVFVEDDDLAQDLSEAAAQPVEDATTFVAAEPAEEPLLELDDADIMPLDDADILEEELELLEEPLDLVEDDFDSDLAVEPALPKESFEDLALEELPMVEEDELELAEEDLLDPAPAVTATEEPMALADAFDGLVAGDLQPVAGVAEALTPEEPESLLVENQLLEEPLWDVVEPAMTEPAASAVEELLELESPAELPPAAESPVPPVLPPVAAPVQTAATVEAQVQGLSEADLSRIVERVAGEVIERLAGTILERMAWEVVPDLAETLIREEIRKIRDNVA